MKNLINLLERFSQSLNKDILTKEAIALVIKEVTKVELSTENISLKNGVLELSTSNVGKNEIALKEDLVRNILKAKGIHITRILYK